MLFQNLDCASSSWAQPDLQCWIESDLKLSQFAPSPSAPWRAEKQLGKRRWKWDHAATLLKTRRRAFKNNPRSEHMLLVLALMTARPATGKCNLSKAPYLCDTWKAACKMLSLSNTLVYQVGAKWSDATCFSGDFFTASFPGPPEPTCDIQLCLRFPSQQSSCGAETYLEKQLKKISRRRRNFLLWQTERFGQTAEPSSVHWWVVKNWLNQCDLTGTGKLPVGPNWGLSGINWVQQAPVSYRRMHPVIAALTVDRRQGSVKTRGWEMHHIITDSNSWKNDFCMEKSWGGEGKRGRKGRELTL